MNESMDDIVAREAKLSESYSKVAPDINILEGASWRVLSSVARPVSHPVQRGRTAQRCNAVGT